jgi:uncharacterized membrane-anchored protein YitT (DUF2179 family)
LSGFPPAKRANPGTHTTDMQFLVSLVASVLGGFATMCKICLSIYGRKERAGLSWIGEMSMCTALFILSVLLGIFSIKRDELATEVLLSLTDGAVIIYQVNFLVCFMLIFTNLTLFTFSKWLVVWHVSLKYTERQRKLVVFPQVAVIVIVSALCGVPLRKGREDLRYLAFCFWAFEYFLFCVIYSHLQRHYQHGLEKDEKTKSVKILSWNKWFSCISLAISISSLALLAKGKLDFGSSLLVRYYSLELRLSGDKTYS